MSTIEQLLPIGPYTEVIACLTGNLYCAYRRALHDFYTAYGHAPDTEAEFGSVYRRANNKYLDA